MARLAAEERDKQRAIGARVAELREARRLTQPVVAERVGVSLRAYQNWEAGSTRIAWPNLVKLADILDSSEDYILYGRDEPAAAPAEDNLIHIARYIAESVDELKAQNARLEERLRRLEGREGGRGGATG